MIFIVRPINCRRAVIEIMICSLANAGEGWLSLFPLINNRARCRYPGLKRIIAGSPSSIGAWTFIGVVGIYYRGRLRAFFFHARRHSVSPILDRSLDPAGSWLFVKSSQGLVPDRRAVAVNPRR